MEENRKYRTRIDDFIDGKTENKENDILYRDNKAESKKYTSVNFVWLDGRQHAFTYSYLVSVSFETRDTGNIITANFTSHQVSVQGYKLYPIYEGLMNHTAGTVKQTESRFASLSDAETPEVNEITVV